MVDAIAEHGIKVGQQKDFTKGGGSVMLFGNNALTEPLFKVCGGQLGAKGCTSSVEKVFKGTQTDKGLWEPRWKICTHCDTEGFEKVNCEQDIAIFIYGA